MILFGNYANRTENSYSSGTEQKDLARVFSDCVLHKENYALALASASEIVLVNLCVLATWNFLL